MNQFDFLYDELNKQRRIDDLQAHWSTRQNEHGALFWVGGPNGNRLTTISNSIYEIQMGIEHIIKGTLILGKLLLDMEIYR